jgi:hypothetical protein
MIDLNDLIFKEDSPNIDTSIKAKIKKSITIKPCSESTIIFVLAFHPSKNKLTSIVFKDKSTPIGGYAYDTKFGQYYVECANYLDLGTIPISFSIRIDKIGRWECRIPLTELIIKEYLDREQKEKLRDFKDKNLGSRFEFMQLVSCY